MPAFANDKLLRVVSVDVLAFAAPAPTPDSPPADADRITPFCGVVMPYSPQLPKSCPLSARELIAVMIDDRVYCVAGSPVTTPEFDPTRIPLPQTCTDGFFAIR